MRPLTLSSSDYAIGDLVYLLTDIDSWEVSVEKGEIGLIVHVYDTEKDVFPIYDCKIKLKCGRILECWFCELIKLNDDD